MQSKIAKAVLLGLPALVVLGCGSGAVTSDDESVKAEIDSGKKVERGNVVGNWKILTKKPRFTESYGMFDTVKVKVRNVSDEEDEPWLEIRLTNRKGDLVTTFDCLGDTVDPGQRTTLNCTSLDDYAPFAEYEIKNAI